MSEKKATAETAAEETEAIDEAANADQRKPRRAPGEASAERAELSRQADVVDAVAKANDEDLPKLGGPLRNPGLGR